jgi:hypothetical protein
MIKIIICPKLKGSILYITHPFATNLNPLDLHVLSILLAFILSQDKTHCYNNLKYWIKLS